MCFLMSWTSFHKHDRSNWICDFSCWKLPWAALEIYPLVRLSVSSDSSNSNYEKVPLLIYFFVLKIVTTQKLKLWQNLKTEIVTKLKKNVTTCKSNCVKTQKLELWQKSKTQIVTKLKNRKCDKTQLKLWQLKNSNCDNSKSQTVRKLKKKNSKGNNAM